MNSAFKWRLFALFFLALLFVVKFLFLGPIRQISPAQMNLQLAKVISDSGAQNIVESKRVDQDGLRKFTFTIIGCDRPYIAIQALTLEDIQSALNHAQPMPFGLEPHVFYLGEEHTFTDRLGLKLTAVRQFVLYRLGLSAEMPSAYLYVVLAAPHCTSYRKLEWWRVWMGSK